ncbi:MAG: hypothetical protein KDB32_08520, partial [Planctomycetes bacterium]|nr:hypothetical protein [Planctomycetota bacterium]
MRRYSLLLLSLFVGLFLTCWSPTHESAQAQDEKPCGDEPDAEERSANPFNENMTWAEAEKEIAKAVEGDDEAFEKVSAGRLAWCPVMEQSGHWLDCVYWEHRLIEDDIDWIRSMQQWELQLVGIDAGAIASGYVEREKMFRLPESQLARAVIACGLLGAHADMDSLVKRNPDSPWVKGALGWLGEYPDTHQCVDAMLGVLKLSADNLRYTFNVQPGLLDDDASEHEFGSREYCTAETNLFFSPDGVKMINSIPVQWKARGLIESLGVRISELPTSREREKAISRVADFLGAEDNTNIEWRALLAGGRPNETNSGAPIPGLTAQTSRGPLLREYAANVLKGYDRSRRWSAMACFHGHPGWQPAQGWMLKEAFASDDEDYAKLAVRAILGLRDDRLDGILSIASELTKSSLLTQEAATFRAALEDSGDDRLMQSAKAMAGQGKFPVVMDRKPLGLSDSVRASLVCAFADPAELEVYGGPLGVLWMNRGNYLFGHMCVYGAVDAYSKVLTHIRKTYERKHGFAATYEMWRNLRRLVPYRIQLSMLEVWKADYPDFASEMLRVNSLFGSNPPEDASDKECAVANLENGIRAPEIDDELRKIIQENPDYVGGYGLSLLGYRPSVDFDWSERNALWLKAQKATPTDMLVWECGMPLTDSFGRHFFMNWFSVEHYAQCAALLRPYNLEVYTRLASIQARAGSPARELYVLMLQAGDHAQAQMTKPSISKYLRQMQFTRPMAEQLMIRQLAAFGGDIHQSWRPTLRGVMMCVSRGWDYSRELKFVTFQGHKGDYLSTCADYELSGGRNYDDVNFLLNISIITHGMCPEYTLNLVARAENLGVSRYGRFVASQAYIRAKAQLGEWDDAIERYREFRGGSVGYPPYLDSFLMYGLLEGNQYEHLDAMFAEFKKHETDFSSSHERFALRRALMAAGKHSAVIKVEAPEGNREYADDYNIGPYSP